LQDLGCSTTVDNRKVVHESAVTVVAVKPNIVHPVLKEVHDVLDASKLVISVAMGVTLEKLEAVGHVPKIWNRIITIFILHEMVEILDFFP
jgi:pyrroline-5-carboxylate reductase